MHFKNACEKNASDIVQKLTFLKPVNESSSPAKCYC